MANRVAASYLIVRSHYETVQNVPREQPVPFSHKHHVGGLGIDCRYCHTTVEYSAFANIPPTKICMNCHSRDVGRQSCARACARKLQKWEVNRVDSCE